MLASDYPKRGGSGRCSAGSIYQRFRNIDSYRGDATFGAWLKRIVVNKAINAVNKKKHEPIPDDDKWDVAEEEPLPEYREGLTVDRVKQGIEKLPDGYRTVLSLYLLEGYDHQEIGEIMGITESTSKSQLNRAKGKLKELLKSIKVLQLQMSVMKDQLEEFIRKNRPGI